jgi:hypothetical protein
MTDEKQTRGGGAVAEEHRQDLVEVTINNEPRMIHRGRQTVAEIKEAGHVAPADELSQLVGGKYVLLPDGGSVVIRGGEEFQSNPRAGGSS